jgi:hypothetical protein
MAHRAHTGLHEHIISKQAARAFANRIRERDIGGKKTLKEALELETADIAAKKPSRVRQMTARTFWRSQPPPPQRNVETTNSLRAGAVGAPTTFEGTVLTNLIKKMTDTGYEMIDAQITSGSQKEETKDADRMKQQPMYIHIRSDRQEDHGR